jgi:hypothetical protein
MFNVPTGYIFGEISSAFRRSLQDGAVLLKWAKSGFVHIFSNSNLASLYKQWNWKENCVALVREQTMPTERSPLAAEVCPTSADRGCRVVSTTDSYGRILSFLDRSRYFFFQAAP